MSLIYTNESANGYITVFCPACWVSVGEYTITEVGELARANVQPFCFDCDQRNCDTIPSQVVACEDHYFLGVQNNVFIAQWLNDNYEVTAKDLMLSRISLLTYFDLKTGRGPQYVLRGVQ